MLFLAITISATISMVAKIRKRTLKTERNPIYSLEDRYLSDCNHQQTFSR